MVHENYCRKRVAKKEMSPRFKGTNDHEKFSIVDLIISFSRGKRLRKVGTGMVRAIFVFLEKYSSSGDKRGVGGNGKLAEGIRILKDRGRGEAGAKGFEGRGLSFCPREWGIFLSEVDEGTSDGGVLGDEGSIEVAESEEGMDFSEILRLRPI
jgi:hypothetical protein